MTVHFKTSSVESLDNNVKEIFRRVTYSEEIIEGLQKSEITLKANKAEKSIFDSEIKKIKEDIR